MMAVVGSGGFGRRFPLRIAVGESKMTSSSVMTASVVFGRGGDSETCRSPTVLTDNSVSRSSNLATLTFSTGLVPEKNGLATASSSSEPRYFLARFDTMVSSPSAVVNDRFNAACGVKNVFFAVDFASFFAFSRACMVAVISFNDRDRLGEKNERIDFGGVGAFGLYGDAFGASFGCCQNHQKGNTFVFSFSSSAESNGALVMGCNSPRATPRAISVS